MKLFSKVTDSNNKFSNFSRSKKYRNNFCNKINYNFHSRLQFILLFIFMFCITFSLQIKMNVQGLVNLEDLINPSKFSSKNKLFSNKSNFKNYTELDSTPNIILQTLNSNPNDIKTYLPSLPKIVTKSGLTCDFPYEYEKIQYFNKCAQRSDGKAYCKVKFMTHKANYILNKKSSSYLFNQFFESDSKLIFIKDDYFSECLSLDETEQYLGQVVDNLNNFDFKKKLLIDLFSAIKSLVTSIKEEKLNLLYELSENYCKSTNFNIDCLYENLIFPISKTKELKELSNKIFIIFEGYKQKLKKILQKSVNLKTQNEEYIYITDRNIQEISTIKSISNLNVNLQKSQLDKQLLYSKEELEFSLSTELIEKNSIYSKISVSQFYEILISIYDICNEECKSAIEYLFRDNLMDDIDRFKLEIVSKLFNIQKIDENFLYQKIITKDKKFIIFNNSTYTINSQSERFIYYKFWSIRYLITVLYRYILMEKLFYTEIILGELSEVELSKILFESEINLEDKQLLKIKRSVPLLAPYITFSRSLQNKIKSIYDKSEGLTGRILNNLASTNSTLTNFQDVSKFLLNVLADRLQFIKKKGSKTSQKIRSAYPQIKNLTSILNAANHKDSKFKKISLQSQLGNMEYINNNIYLSSYLSQDCHKFLHFHSYFDDFSFGKPNLGYISLSYEPFFFLDFEQDIKLFFVYGLVNMNTDYLKKYSLVIKTQAKVDVYFNNELKQPNSITPITDVERYTNMNKFTYEIESTGFKNSYKELMVKGVFEGKLADSTDKHFELKVKSASEEINKNKISSNYSKNKKFSSMFKKKVSSKCTEPLHEVSLCFNPYSYKVDCDIGCKYLSKKIEDKLFEKDYISQTEKIYFGEPGKKFKIKKIVSPNLSDNEEYKKNVFKNKVNTFLETCNNYCSVFMWTIPIYKCLNRNIRDNNFDSLLIKCGALGNWNIVSRKLGNGAKDNMSYNQNSLWHRHSKTFSINDILLGKKFLVENTKENVKLNYIPYMQSSLLNPLSNVTFIENFKFDKISEYLFASGDMQKFLVLDKYQPLINGAPFSAFTKYNYQVRSKLLSSKGSDVFTTSIFNLKYDQANFGSDGIVIYDKKFSFSTKPGKKSKFSSKESKTNSVLFSDNDKFNLFSEKIGQSYYKEANLIFEENQGANIFTRSNSATCLLYKPFFTSNLISQQFYVENTLFTKNIYTYLNSKHLVMRLPEEFDQSSLLLKTTPYQTNYSLNINSKSEIYLAIEITKYFGQIAEKLIKDNWKFLNGTSKIIELISSDIGDEVLEKLDYSFYDCSFTNNENPICKDNVLSNLEKIQLSVFYKKVDIGTVPISYSFFDFDDLYGSLHLLFLKPLECKKDKNSIYTYQDKVNNFMKVYYDYLPTYDSDIDNFVNGLTKFDTETPSPEIEKKSNLKVIKNNINHMKCDEMKKEKFADFFVFLEYNYKKLLTVNHEENEKILNFTQTKMSNESFNDLYKMGLDESKDKYIFRNRTKILENKYIYEEEKLLKLNKIKNFTNLDAINKNINNSIHEFSSLNLTVKLNSSKIDSDFFFHKSIGLSKNITNIFTNHSNIKKLKNKNITHSFINNSSIKKFSNNPIIFKTKNNNSKTQKSKDSKNFHQSKVIPFKNFSKPSIKLNQNGCIVSLDRFGNLYYRHINNLINSNQTSLHKNLTSKKWQIIQMNVKLFDMSENMIITLDFHNNLRMQSGFNQNNECLFHPHNWKNLFLNNYSGLYIDKSKKVKINKIAISQLNCLWVTDSFNKLYFINNYDFLKLGTKNATANLEEYFYSNTKLHIKDFYATSDKLYIVTRDNKIYVKKNIYDFLRGNCKEGDVRYFFKNNKI